MHGALNHCGEEFQKDAVLVSEFTRFSCGRKVNSCEKVCGFKNILIVAAVA